MNNFIFQVSVIWENLPQMRPADLSQLQSLEKKKNNLLQGFVK